MKHTIKPMLQKMHRYLQSLSRCACRNALQFCRTQIAKHQKYKCNLDIVDHLGCFPLHSRR